MSRKKDSNGFPIPYRRGNIIYEHIYEITLYQESETANMSMVLKLVQTLYKRCDWVYIFHDKDIKDDGEPKKPHFHLLLNFPREKSIKKVAEELGIPVNLIEWKCFLDKSVQYLIHLNNPNKAQYDIDKLQGNTDWYMQFLGGDFTSSEKMELDQITKFITNNKGHTTFYQIYIYVAEHNLLPTYKKWYNIIRDIYQEP